VTVVVDASVAAKWLLAEADSELAAGLLADDLIAPVILRLECANAIVKRLRVGQLDAGEARQRIDEIGQLPVRLFETDDQTAAELALELRHPVYDCAYLALAQARSLQVVTADRRFVDAANAAGYGAHIRLLASVQT